jgi:hypothetical protein
MSNEQLNELKIKLEENIKYNIEEFQCRSKIKYAYYDIFEGLSLKEQIELLLYCINNDAIETSWTLYYLEEKILELDLQEKIQIVSDLHNFYESKKEDEILYIISKVLTDLLKNERMSLEQAVDLFIISFKKKNQQLDYCNIETIFNCFEDRKSEFTLVIYEKIKYLFDDEVKNISLKLFSPFFKEILELPIDFNEIFRVTKKIFLANFEYKILNSYLLSLINKKDTNLKIIFDFILTINDRLSYTDIFCENIEVLKCFTIEQQKELIELLAWNVFERHCADNYYRGGGTVEFLEKLKEFASESNIKMSREFFLLLQLQKSQLRIDEIENSMAKARIYF